MKFNTQFTTKNDVLYSSELPSMTDQSLEPECNISKIIQNCLRTGQPLPQQSVSYADLTNSTIRDYQDALITVSNFRNAFEGLPAVERDKFGNVENYIKFISNPENLKESYEKGFIDRSTVDLHAIYPERYQSISGLDNGSSSTVQPSQNDSTVEPPNNSVST